MRRRLRSVSLTTKVVLPLIALAVVAAGLTVWYANVEHRRQLDVEAVKRADTLMRAIEHTANVTDQPGLRRSVSSLGSDREVQRIIVVGGQDPVVLASTRGALIGRSAIALEPDVSRQIITARRDDSVDRGQVTEEDGSMAVARRLVVRPTAPDGTDFSGMVAYVELDLSPIERGVVAADRAEILMLIALIAAVSIGGFVVFRLTVLRRVQAIEGALRSRRAGRQVPVPALGSDALGDLARTLDDTMTALAESEHRTRAIVENAADGIMTVDETGRIESFNRAAEAMFGYQESEIVGRHVVILIPDELRTTSALELLRTRALETFDGRRATIELDGVRRDGTRFPVSFAVSELQFGDKTTFTAILHDLSATKAFEEQLEHQATHDLLTGLPNRVLLFDRLEQTLARRRRNELSTAVLFLDIDRFKFINDSLGHDAGDRLLIEAAIRVGDAVRASDTVARFGGDEFVVLCEDVEELSDVVALARRIADNMARPFRLNRDEIVVSTSIGIAVAEGTSKDLAVDLIRKADLAMYRAKSGGGDRYAMFDDEMQAWADERLDTETALRHALDRQELRLHYQPIVDLQSGRVAGVEALVRWERPGVGLVPPSAFIPVAEEAGLIAPIGAWVLGEACSAAAHWNQRDGVTPITMSVNVSARQLLQGDFPATVHEALEVSHLPPHQLVLEITESVLLDDAPKANAVLERFKAMGTRLSLDDFGTGHSSLLYLRTFPIDILKIDQSFVHDLGRTATSETIVGSVVSLARGLGLHVVAEGVEQREHVDALVEMGCDLAQGFYFAKPAPPEAIDELLGDSTRNGRLAPARGGGAGP